MADQRKTIIIATQNQGKLKEFRDVFKELGFEVRGLAEYSDLPEIIEDGATFAENAFIKAKRIADHLQLPVIADDSGLCVDALGGRPGVYSARYAGADASDQENNEKLIAELSAIGSAERIERSPSVAAADISVRPFLSHARFVCALIVYYPDSGRMIQVEGECHGYITSAPKGEHGFGYDPLFVVPQYNLTMAELSPQLKHTISHRGEAIRKLLIEMKPNNEWSSFSE